MENELSDKDLISETIKRAAKEGIHIHYDDSMLSNPLVLEALAREKARKEKESHD